MINWEGVLKWSGWGRKLRIRGFIYWYSVIMGILLIMGILWREWVVEVELRGTLLYWNRVVWITVPAA